jgi:hypothetical protein
VTETWQSVSSMKVIVGVYVVYQAAAGAWWSLRHFCANAPELHFPSADLLMFVLSISISNDSQKDYAIHCHSSLKRGN